MKHYIAARPETVVSIIQFGRLPETLPGYLEGERLVISDVASQSFTHIRTALDQIFIIEFDITDPTQRNIVQPAFFQRIVCYSVKGEKLLRRLLKDIRHPVIEINSAAYASLVSATHVQEQSVLESPAKKQRTLSVCHSTVFSPPRSPSIVKRLSSPADHMGLLRRALQVAQKKILITSYDISHNALLRMDFYADLRLALSRGVKIYIYYNDKKGADPEALRRLSRLSDVYCDEAFTHSKFLCVDDQWVSIGSFNWLSFYAAEKENDETEGSIVSYDRELNKQLIQEIWKHLRLYRNLQFGNMGAVCKFDRNPANEATVSYPFSSGSEMEYIPTLEQHCGFLQEVLRQAKRKIVICSPFLSMRQCLEDIDASVLRSLSERNVAVFFVTSNRSPEYAALEHYLNSMHSETIHLIGYADFHLKTLIILETAVRT
ncbi:MAG: hypothetical protein KBD83_08075 [Gammaproteobacteria bacterium]|nr:hypothetical protein [Gammaproteobacteria bacterium]